MFKYSLETSPQRALPKGTVMLSFLFIGVTAMALAILGFYLTVKLMRKPLPWQEWVALCLCAVLFVFGLFQSVQAAAVGGRHYEGVAASVDGVNHTPEGLTVLTVRTGEIGTLDITCEPQQLACQQAERGDLVQYDRSVHASGWFNTTLRIGFIAPGANSQPR